MRVQAPAQIVIRRPLRSYYLRLRFQGVGPRPDSSRAMLRRYRVVQPGRCEAECSICKCRGVRESRGSCPPSSILRNPQDIICSFHRIHGACIIKHSHWRLLLFRYYFCRDCQTLAEILNHLRFFGIGFKTK